MKKLVLALAALAALAPVAANAALPKICFPTPTGFYCINAPTR